MYKSSRKILVRVCEVANSRRVKPFRMFNLYSSMNRRAGADDKDHPKELETTGHDRFCQIRHSRYETIDEILYFIIIHQSNYKKKKKTKQKTK